MTIILEIIVSARHHAHVGVGGRGHNPETIRATWMTGTPTTTCMLECLAKKLRTKYMGYIRFDIGLLSGRLHIDMDGEFCALVVYPVY